MSDFFAEEFNKWRDSFPMGNPAKYAIHHTQEERKLYISHP